MGGEEGRKGGGGKESKGSDVTKPVTCEWRKCKYIAVRYLHIRVQEE